MHIDNYIHQILTVRPIELRRHHLGERHYVLQNTHDFQSMCFWLAENNYDLCTAVATDERDSESHTFKIYLVFTGPGPDPDTNSQTSLSKSPSVENWAIEGGWIILEYPLNDPQNPTRYPSLQQHYPEIALWEKEVCDLFGIFPLDKSYHSLAGSLLHPENYTLENYDADSFPMRYDWKGLPSLVKDRELPDLPDLPDGMLIIPVGPIHAGIKSADRFDFFVAGEIIEKIQVRLGYKHRGVEKLFEDKSLKDGWKLAERICGDMSVAHSISYSNSVENLGDVEISRRSQYWRTLLLEMERLYNHIADIGLLIHDIAYDRISTHISILQEVAMQFNATLTGSRVLRGVCRPGGVFFHSGEPNLNEAWNTIKAIRDDFLELTSHVINNDACRDRLITTGVLPFETARQARGVIARSAGRLRYDARLQHPQGAYCDPQIGQMIRQTITSNDDLTRHTIQVTPDILRGDVFSRMMFRVAEIETACQIIEYCLKQIDTYSYEPLIISLDTALSQADHFTIGLGSAESWRGEVFYWLMKGPENTIWRCKVHDPSQNNWLIFPELVQRKKRPDKEDKYWEDVLADFPLDNKSCNNALAGSDL